MLAWLLTDVQDLNISVGEVLLNTVLRVLLPLIVSILIIIIILYYISIVNVSICPSSNLSLSPSHNHVVLMVFDFVFWAKAVRIMGGLDYYISSQTNSCLFLNNINYLNNFNWCARLENLSMRTKSKFNSKHN